MKKGGNDKKKNTKEIEAERLAEEQRLAEEKRIEDLLKYGIRDLIKEKSYPMILTSWYIEQAWSHETPRAFTKEYLTEQFTRFKIIHLVTDDEIELYANTILRNLIFGKNKLSLENEKLSLLINLLFGVQINGDSRFGFEFEFVDHEAPESEEAVEEIPDKKAGGKAAKGNKGKKEEKVQEVEVEEESEEEDELSRSMIEVGDSLAAKTYESDMLLFRTRLKELVSSDLELFDKVQIGEIAKHTIESYFNNFTLFTFFQNNKQLEEDLFIQVTVDEPYVAEPLSQANYTAKILTKEEEEEERAQKLRDMLEADRLEDEKKAAEAEALKKEYEEWMGLDKATIKMIQEKLDETKGYMMKRIDEKKIEYEEKLANMKGGKKKR